MRHSLVHVQSHRNWTSAGKFRVRDVKVYNYLKILYNPSISLNTFKNTINHQNFSLIQQSFEDSVMDLFVRILSDYDAVNAARRLLYEVYISEMGWDFRSDSPTDFRIDKDDQNKPILCDTFDDSSVWFGAYKGDSLIGVTRAVQRNNSLGKLDLELYPASQLPSMKRILRPKADQPLVEVQRGAVAKDYRNTQPSIIQLLLHSAFSYALEKGLNVVCPTVFPVLETLFSRAGMRLVEKKFTYGEGCDEWPTYIFYCSSEDMAQVVNKLKTAARKRKASVSQERGHAKRGRFLVV